jgi:hypothetical protein
MWWWLVGTGFASPVAGPTHAYSTMDNAIAGVVETASGDALLIDVEPAPWGASHRVLGPGGWSPMLDGIPRMSADLDGDGTDELLLEQPSRPGGLVAVDIAHGAEVLFLPTERIPVDDTMLAVDLDGDGIDEVVGNFCARPALCVLDVAGVSWWDSPYAYEGTLAVVQGDADPELELVVRAQLRDAHTGAILRTLSLPSGAEAYASGDVDGDGPDDLVFWTASGVHAYDVVDDAPRWLVASPMLLQPLPPILFDLDDDGLDEVLVSSPALVVDGVTGAVLREPSICGRLVGVHQFGRPWLGCHYHGLLASGPEVRETPGLGRVDQLEAIDLDGDGQRELVALGTRAHVFDPDGRRLTTNHHGHTWWLEFLRRPGGPRRLVDVRQGVVPMRWSPRHGLARGPAIVGTASAFADPVLLDADADGVLDLFFQGGSLRRLDLSTGVETQWAMGRAPFRELMPDPGPERLYLQGGSLEVRSLTRSVHLPADAYDIVDLRSGAQVLAVAGTTVSVWDLQRSTTQPVASATLPMSPDHIWWDAGRAWYHDGTRLHAVSLSGSPDWSFDLDAPLVAAPVVLDGSVWFATEQTLTRWELPPA